MRLFVAAELPEDLVCSLSETSARLRSCVRGRYVAPDLFHVTLAFLGERPQEQVPQLAGLVERACSWHEAFSTTLGSLGSFGRRSSAVLWEGFGKGSAAWQSLAASVHSELREVGFTYEYAQFLPHVTLMRRADITHGVLPMPCIEQGTIRSVALFSSDLSGERPRYEALERFSLVEEC